MQENVTINLTVPKELVPSLMSFVNAVKRVTGDKTPETPKPNGAPTEEEVVRYCIERNSSVDGHRFYSWCADRNWVDKKGNPINDWKAKVIEWESYRMERQQGKYGNKQPPSPSQRDFVPTDFG